eukprot:c10177_g1_i1.p1 GENE.c10177_g1_i1~~c10177_g1_i1.p1  ORF type:complete len:585 (+),score=155.26 c10177_g1_i1:153-1907(+)
MDINVLTLGLTNALRTGNVAVDMLLSTVMCMLIPIIVNHAFGFLKSVALQLWGMMLSARNVDKICRHITTSRFRDQYGSWNNEDKNHILEKAILLFIQNKSSKKWVSVNEEAVLTLLDTERDNFSDTSDDEDDVDADKPKRTLTYLERQIRRLTLTLMPKDEDEIEVEPGLWFSLNKDSGNKDENADKSKSTKQSTTTITLKAKGPEAHTQIDEFVNRAFLYYQELIGSKGKDKRHMLCLSSKAAKTSSNNNNNNEGSPSGLVFTKYPLTEEKTFASLFLPQKKDLLKLLDDFTLRRGKFAVSGFPKKLGILLHGPPGTGKTSLIKAIAQYTQRHIVSIPLKRIKTNQELMDLMFGRQFACQGEDLPLRLPFKKLIFVMEDVDAASEVVRRRDESPQGRRKRKPAQPSTSTQPTMPIGEDAGGDSGGDVLTSGLGAASSASKGTFGPELPNFKWLEPDDELDLAGLLNALDGVVDCPGRIVVMTTNHPDKLDPALIRPGRVNIKLHLGFMHTAEAQQMADHYYGGGAFSEAEKLQFAELFPSGNVSPARLEEMCAEHDTASQLLETLALHAKGKRLSEIGWQCA